MAARARRAQAGFTLLEVVLAMTLLAMVTGMVYAAFHLGVRTVEKGQAAVVSAQRARAASDVLRRQVKSMFPYPCVVEEGEDPVPFFELRDNPPMMEFVTAAGLNGGGGLEFVRYEVQQDPPRLVLTAIPMAGFEESKCGSINTDGASRAVLLDGFRSLEFEPLVYDEGDSWKGGEGVIEFGLPRSIRVKIDGLAGSATIGGSTEWTIPIVANLESDDGWRVFSQLFEEGEGITIAGSAAAEEEADQKAGNGGAGSGVDDSGDDEGDDEPEGGE
jgi:prepilin-type N-terminal cleavage/methylation domain-containing protein